MPTLVRLAAAYVANIRWVKDEDMAVDNVCERHMMLAQPRHLGSCCAVASLWRIDVKLVKERDGLPRSIRTYIH